MKIAYFDCFSGISGDMFLGSLLDAGLPFEVMEQSISSLPLKGYSLKASPESKMGISGTQFTVNVERASHPHRKLKDIREIILSSNLSPYVKDNSVRIFEAVAQVEGKIHGHDPEEVSFHEVGAVDSIIDIVGAVIGIEYLGINKIVSSALPLGSGFIETAHGRIPIPAPATIALLKDVPVYDSGIQQEMVTPTGAALLKTFAESFGAIPPMSVNNIGYGCGSRDLSDRPNLLRVLIGNDDAESKTVTDVVTVIETNIDDINPEIIGFLMERLLKAGALDASFCPIQMKKNRPGILLQVIGRPEDKDILTDLIFRETSTLGVRYRLMERKILQRSVEQLKSPWGPMKVKKIINSDGTTYFLPEYEVCKQIAGENAAPLKTIYDWVSSLNQ